MRAISKWNAYELFRINLFGKVVNEIADFLLVHDRSPREGFQCTTFQSRPLVDRPQGTMFSPTTSMIVGNCAGFLGDS